MGATQLWSGTCSAARVRSSTWSIWLLVTLGLTATSPLIAAGKSSATVAIDAATSAAAHAASREPPSCDSISNRIVSCYRPHQLSPLTSTSFALSPAVASAPNRFRFLPVPSGGGLRPDVSESADGVGQPLLEAKSMRRSMATFLADEWPMCRPDVVIVRLCLQDGVSSRNSRSRSTT